MDVVIVGAGVVGLATARVLAGDGHRVTVITRDDPLATTSAAAAASFKPRLVAGGPVGADLLVRSRRVLEDWDRSGLGARFGLSRTTHVEAGSAPVHRDYLHVMADVRRLSRARGDRLPAPRAGVASEGGAPEGGAPDRAASTDGAPGVSGVVLPPGTTHAVAYETWFLDVPVALPALVDEVVTRGVEVVRATVGDLDDDVVHDRRPDVVVNAAGVHAGTLAGDSTMAAVQGQVVAVDRGVSPVTLSVSTDRGAYVYPRRHDILLGGTAREVDLAALDSAHLRPDAATTAAIVARAGRLLAHLDPNVAAPDTWPVRGVAVGLRPWRPGGIRLEVDHTHRVPVVHAYGHGGAGWTLAPGTAEWVGEAIAALSGTTP